MPIVSIVVPVYNSSKTIKECLESLKTQTLEDVEIICVDDCSADESVFIVEHLMETDDRIKIIKHETNKGTLKTRYDGVMAATGRYIMFIDGDDLYFSNTCETAVKKIEETKSDMVQFGTKVVAGNSKPGSLEAYEPFLKPICKSYYGEDVFKMQFNGICWHVWNRIFDSELCKKSYRCAGESYIIFSDDLYVSFFLSYFSKHFESIPDKLYIYRLETGLTNSLDHFKKMNTICNNSIFIYNCMDFLRKEGREDLIDVCFKPPLLEMGHSFHEWNLIDDIEEKINGAKILKDTWCNNIFKEQFDSYSKKYGIENGYTVKDYLKALTDENVILEKRKYDLENSIKSASKNVVKTIIKKTRK